MQLTEEQLEVVRSGYSVRFNAAGTEFVILRADVFERLRDELYDTSPWTDEEMDLLRWEACQMLDSYGKDV